ncbi:heavy-metal-associated domain-containing protein [Microbacterium sp. NPDC056234]|uniref:heavy-metal-associated domain-containing protein n=1 Tax=Microbacterium sp. NPDC056234 TaxID=3345757 RepID=UPI0035DE895C
MNTAGRLGLYGAGLVVAFGAAYLAAGAIVPDSAVAAWSQASHADDPGHAAEQQEPADTEQKEQEVTGVTISASGFTLAPLAAPAATGTDGELAFRILTADGDPVTAYETAHGKQLHLIVVRNDGTQYRHVHPELDAATGVWSLPWTWDAAGTYRVYTDFVSDGTAATLSRTVDVAGTLTPNPATEVITTASVDGFDVAITGDLVAGADSDLTVEVTRDGEPVTTLEPYLGAFGHLVALRDGDLAYLHVHAHGDEPEPGDTAGPAVAFTAGVPTAGRYLLYLDFQVDGQVRTAQFVLDAVASDAAPDHGSDGGDDHGGH